MKWGKEIIPNRAARRMTDVEPMKRPNPRPERKLRRSDGRVGDPQ